MMWLRAASVILVLVSAGSGAADKDGRFAIRGPGLLTCAEYVQARAARSPLYHQFGGWLDGYLTGVNQHRAATYDITTFETTELLALVIDNHCSSHPQDHVFTVMNSIVALLDEARLRQGSPSVEVTVGPRSARLYAEAVRRAQAELARLKLYGGAQDGNFTAATEQALAAFQRAQSLEPTGFPDQTTLWRLLRREAPR